MESPPDLDLGSDRVAWWTRWAPDRDINPQFADLPDVDRVGLIIQHGDVTADGRWCVGGVTFDSEAARRVFPNNPRWTVESWEPLTINPSVLVRECVYGGSCHGFIRGGRWVGA